MTAPNTWKEFVGSDLVKYYRDMCTRRSHILEAWTNLMSSKVNYKRIGAKQKVFEKFKCIVSHNTLLSYTYWNKQFLYIPIGRYFQLGWIIFIVEEVIQIFSIENQMNPKNLNGNRKVSAKHYQNSEIVSNYISR